MDLNSECYAICKIIGPGLFSNQRSISLGNDLGDIIVDEDSLRKTKDGFTAVRFYLSDIKKGLATGYVYNCDDNPSNGYIDIPLDSLSSIKETLPFKNKS